MERELIEGLDNRDIDLKMKVTFQGTFVHVTPHYAQHEHIFIRMVHWLHSKCTCDSRDDSHVENLRI